MGINIFTSSMFTAFSNGRISALISVLRTLVLVIIGIIVLPMLFNLNGIKHLKIKNEFGKLNFVVESIVGKL